MYRDPALVFRNLWMGSEAALQDYETYACVISAAEEVEPPTHGAHETIHLPLVDGRFCWKERKSFAPVVAVARIAASYVNLGRPVLVVCHSGLNRSGLVCALTTVLLHDFEHRERAIQRVRDARGPRALSNSWFVSAIIYPPWSAFR